MHRTRALSVEQLRHEFDLLDPDLPVALASVDVDGFAALNDEQGPDAGDRALGAIEAQLVTGVGAGALVGHVKGDEWIVVQADVLPEDLLISLDAVRRRIATDGPLPITAGIAGRPQHGVGFDELVAAAGTGMVRAKQAGRNRIAMAVDERMILKSSYYTRVALHRLAKLAARTGHTEAHHLRTALDDHLARHAELL